MSLDVHIFTKNQSKFDFMTSYYDIDRNIIDRIEDSGIKVPDMNDSLFSHESHIVTNSLLNQAIKDLDDNDYLKIFIKDFIKSNARDEPVILQICLN